MPEPVEMSDADRAAEAAYDRWDEERCEDVLREHEQRCDMRRTFGLPPDPIDTDLF